MRFAAVIAMTLAASAPALAHPKLVSATPAPGTAVASPARLQLNFSEALVPRFSGADLLMTQMPGMKMKSPMRIAATATVGTDGKSLVVAPARPLTAGAYRLDYHLVSRDTHRLEGNYVFQVK